MAITVINTTTNVEAASTTNVVSKPTGQDDDVFVAVISCADDRVVSAPGGWDTQLSVTSLTGYDRGMFIYTRVISDYSSEGSTYTFTTVANEGTCASIICLRGVDTTTPKDADAVSETPANVGTTIDAPTITTANDGALVISAALLRQYQRSGGTWTVPSGTPTVTQQVDEYCNPTGINSHALAVGTYTVPSAGATGARTWTESDGQSTDEGIGAQFSLKPSGGAPAVAPTSVIFGPLWGPLRGPI